MRVTPALILGLLLLAPAARAGPGRVTTIQVAEDLKIEAAGEGDVNGDGRTDLVFAVVTRGANPRRHIHVHLRRPDAVCFVAEPDFRRYLVPEVVAFAVGDVENDPGDEVVLFTARGAYSWRPGAGEEQRERRLLVGDFLWQLPDPGEAFWFPGGIRDLDGDGLDDLVFPEPGGYRVARQRRTPDAPSDFTEVSTLRLPPVYGDFLPTSEGAQRMKARKRARELELSIRLGGEARATEPSELTVLDAVPVPIFADWDGDRKGDLVALSGETLLIWRQREGGRFGEQADRAQEFPIEMDKGRRFDLSFGAHSGDLNGDGRVDCVILAGDRRAEDIRTQVLVYLNAVGKEKTDDRPLFGPKGLPQQVLLVGGIVGAVDLTDVDGNGEPDLVLGTVQIDTMDAIRAATSGKIEASLRVYLNRRGTFSRQPDLEYTVEIAAEAVPEAGSRLSARFVPDLTGDGVRELLVRDEPTRLRIHLVRRTEKGLSVFPRPLEEMQVNKRAEVQVFERPSGPPEILVRERRQAHHVRFGE